MSKNSSKKRIETAGDGDVWYNLLLLHFQRHLQDFLDLRNYGSRRPVLFVSLRLVAKQESQDRKPSNPMTLSTYNTWSVRFKTRSNVLDLTSI